MAAIQAIAPLCPRVIEGALAIEVPNGLHLRGIKEVFERKTHESVKIISHLNADETKSLLEDETTEYGVYNTVDLIIMVRKAKLGMLEYPVRVGKAGAIALNVATAAFLLLSLSLKDVNLVRYVFSCRSNERFTFERYAGERLLILGEVVENKFTLPFCVGKEFFFPTNSPISMY
ncbi:MAG: hypothetical protein ABSF47_00175 [Minisyncoccia bacterium]